MTTIPLHALSTPQGVDPRLNARYQEDNSCWTTTFKVASIFAGLLATIAGFGCGLPLLAVAGALVMGGGMLATFLNCHSDHNHTGSRTPIHQSAPNGNPWWGRVFSFLPSFGTHHSHTGRGGPHIVPGGGHAHSPGRGEPHIVPGGGHVHSPGRGEPHIVPGGGHAHSPGRGEPHIVPGGGHVHSPGRGGPHIVPGGGHAHPPGRGGPHIVPGGGHAPPLGRGGQHIVPGGGHR